MRTLYLMVVFILALSGCHAAGKNSAEMLGGFVKSWSTDFEDISCPDGWQAAKSGVSDAADDVISGRRSLVMRTSGPEWYLPFFTSDPAKLPLGSLGYVISFDYRILDDMDDSAMFYVTIAPTAESDGVDGVSFYMEARDQKENTWKGQKGDSGHREVRFVDYPFFRIVPDGKFRVAFGIKTQNMTPLTRGGIAIDNLKIEAVIPDGFRALPGAPKLMSPVDQMRLSSSALQFTWKSSEESQKYEIQFSKDRAFTAPTTASVSNMKLDRSCYYPLEKLDSGRWYWRVRGVNIDGRQGSWSPARVFTLDNQPVTRPVVNPPSPSNPLFVFMHGLSNASYQYYEKPWKSIPDRLKPYTTVEVGIVGESKPARDFRAWCLDMDRMHRQGKTVPNFTPIVRLFNDVFTYQYGTITLSEIEWAYQQNYPWLRGVSIVEQHIEYPMTRRWISDLLALSAKYGQLVVWTEFGPHILLHNKEQADLLAAMRKYRQWVALCHKSNTGVGPMLHMSALLGDWLNGDFEYIGVGAEAWYWWQGGFGPLGQSPRRWHHYVNDSLELNRIYTSFPDNFWVYQAALGLAMGSTVYRFEGADPVPPYHPYPGDMWRNDGTPSPALTRGILPFMDAVVSQKLIPTRTEVEANVKAVLVSDEAYPRIFKDPLKPFKDVYENTCGYWYDFQMVPVTGRYYFLPMLIGSNVEESSRLAAAYRQVQPGQFSGPEEIRDYFNGLYPPADFGSAFVTQVGDLYVILNSHENEDKPKHFKIPIPSSPVTEVEGDVGVHEYLIVKVLNDGVYIHVNNREERYTEIAVRAVGRPEVSVSPKCDYSESWDAAAGRLIIRMDHVVNGAQSIRIN